MATATRADDQTTLPQGDLRLLASEVAQRLLHSTELARLAYVAADGTPRCFPMMFHWNGEEIVFATFAGSAKISALRNRPAVAVSIDTATAPPQVLLLRGQAHLTEVAGVLPEYGEIHRRYYGPEQAGATLAELDHPDLRMVRIAVRPSWVGLLDFVTRFPGGATAEEFSRVGRTGTA